jgi:hypothetical protein
MISKRFPLIALIALLSVGLLCGGGVHACLHLDDHGVDADAACLPGGLGPSA